jgi:ribosomal protein S18 acetylase RimI-like enzyme
VDAFATYRASLVGSWRTMAAPRPDAEVIDGPGYTAAVFGSTPVLDNALLDEPAALADVALTAAGYRRDEVTRPMVLDLARLRPDPDPRARGVAVVPVDASVVARLNGLDPGILAGVPGARARATADGTSGAVLIEVGSDVNLSFVATRPGARRRGLASAVVVAALAEARADGFATSSLQATADGRHPYSRLGYREVGAWQEWVPG